MKKSSPTHREANSSVASELHEDNKNIAYPVLGIGSFAGGSYRLRQRGQGSAKLNFYHSDLTKVDCKTSSHLIKVLLIEDSPTDTLLVRTTLNATVDAGFEVTTADRLESAVHLANTKPFDVILLDLGLPGTQGIETFEHMHASAPHIPIIVLSGLGDDEIAMQAIQEGCQDYLPKGEALNDLLPRSIRYAIERHRLQAECDLYAHELEEVSGKYTELYDFAPVGYFTLDATSAIITANFTGSDLVDVERSLLIGLFFSMSVVPEKRSDFLCFLDRVFVKENGQTIDTEISTNGGVVCPVSIHARRTPNGRECLLAVTDISEHMEIRKQQAILLRQSRKQERRLRELSRQIIHVQEDERKCISRELHDVIAQSLLGINIQLAVLVNELSVKPGDIQVKITSLLTVVEQAVETVHCFARKLRPTMLDDLGLIPTLESFLKNFSNNTGISVEFHPAADIEKFPGEICTTLFRIVKEALANVVSHAQASEVKIVILTHETGISMEITDNGKGFDIGKYQLKKGHRRLGILGMQERAEMVGGIFSIESAPRNGTIIRIIIESFESISQKYL